MAFFKKFLLIFTELFSFTSGSSFFMTPLSWQNLELKFWNQRPLGGSLGCLYFNRAAVVSNFVIDFVCKIFCFVLQKNWKSNKESLKKTPVNQCLTSFNDGTQTGTSIETKSSKSAVVSCFVRDLEHEIVRFLFGSKISLKTRWRFIGVWQCASN